jgi:hypothetical protein
MLSFANVPTSRVSFISLLTMVPEDFQVPVAFAARATQPGSSRERSMP